MPRKKTSHQPKVNTIPKQPNSTFVVDLSDAVERFLPHGGIRVQSLVATYPMSFYAASFITSVVFARDGCGTITTSVYRARNDLTRLTCTKKEHPTETTIELLRVEINGAIHLNTVIAYVNEKLIAPTLDFEKRYYKFVRFTEQHPPWSPPQQPPVYVDDESSDE